MGYYYEMKQEKNADKTIDEIKDIVFKNLAKDPIYYTKQGQFGEDIGYTDDAPSLGPTDEPKGKYKSSGYGNLKENKKPVNEIAIAGGLVTGGGFTSANYKDFFGLNEADDDAAEAAKVADEAERAKAAVDAIAGTKMFEGEAPAHIEKLVDAAEQAYDAGMDVKEIMDMIEQHLGLKMGE